LALPQTVKRCSSSDTCWWRKNKMGWQSHQIPSNFKMYNDYVTSFTIRDFVIEVDLV
jgi:hypothetical protein